MGAGGWMRLPTLDGGDYCSTVRGRRGLAGEKLGPSAVRSSVAAKAARLTSAQGNADVQQAGSPAPNPGTLARTRSNFPIEFLSACGLSKGGEKLLAASKRPSAAPPGTARRTAVVLSQGRHQFTHNITLSFPTTAEQAASAIALPCDPSKPFLTPPYAVY